MAMLLDSVAPLVKMISLGSAPIRSATCCFEETTRSYFVSNCIEIRSHQLDFEKTFFSTNLPSCFHGSLTLPAIGVSSGVRVTIVVNLVGQHGIQHPRVLMRHVLRIQLCRVQHLDELSKHHGYHGCGGLEVHVEGSELILLEFLFLYQLCRQG